MTSKVETEPAAYATTILHCLKYPSKGVLGLLIGQRKGDKFIVKEAVPITHESTPLAPTLELATTFVHSKYGNSLIGVYFANESCRDHSLNPYATRLADKISSICGTVPLLIQVLNDRLMTDCEEERLEAYEKDGDNWKAIKSGNASSSTIRGLQQLIQEKLYRELNDFENHLDAPENDFYNTELVSKIVQIGELRG
ncbi:unnamed protein product [Caenorhabditis auriculariae]|uniref:MPN domain-containing protein n=1 Tax=Caenorhabditis auriculariae TaxID=2777116 RepID=A0A8S1HT49_9PELO|nr:unnamed protein product [Caenorhabditis auriculariae]